MSMILSDAGVQFSDASIQPSAARPQYFSLGVSFASNALTIASQQLSLAFRTSLTSGVVQTITGSPSALTVPSGATLGTINAQASSIIIAVLNNAGTLEYTVQNLAGGSDMSETGLISTTAISASATANNVWYSNTARTNVPYQIIARYDSTQTTAGTWVTSGNIIGAGGQSLTAMSSAGFGQTWQNVTGSRALSTTYYNTTGKQITVSMRTVANTVAISATLTVNGLAIYDMVYASGGTAGYGFVYGDVPPYASYSISASETIGAWREKR